MYIKLLRLLCKTVLRRWRRRKNGLVQQQLRWKTWKNLNGGKRVERERHQRTRRQFATNDTKKLHIGRDRIGDVHEDEGIETRRFQNCGRLNSCRVAKRSIGWL